MSLESRLEEMERCASPPTDPELGQAGSDCACADADGSEETLFDEELRDYDLGEGD